MSLTFNSRCLPTKVQSLASLDHVGWFRAKRFRKIVCKWYFIRIGQNRLGALFSVTPRTYFRRKSKPKRKLAIIGRVYICDLSKRVITHPPTRGRIAGPKTESEISFPPPTLSLSVYAIHIQIHVLTHMDTHIHTHMYTHLCFLFLTYTFSSVSTHRLSTMEKV